MRLSVVVIAKNAEDTIGDCLSSISFADEIVVIDDYSIDTTVKIAKKYGANVYTRHLDDFSSQRNFGMSKAKGIWKLFIDADEIVPKKLANEIVDVIS